MYSYRITNIDCVAVQMYKNDCLMYGEVFENVNQAEKWAIQELNNLRQGAQILARLTRPDND